MNFIQDFAAYMQYFRDLKEQTTYFKFFESGGTEKIVSDRLLADLRSNVEYPLLFVEWPFINLSDYGSSNTQTSFRGGFVVLENPAKDDYAAQDAAMQTTFDAVLQVLGQMRIDTTGLDKRFIYFDLNKVNIDPIDNLTIDAGYGWRAEFELQAPVDIANAAFCRNPAFWV